LDNPTAKNHHEYYYVCSIDGKMEDEEGEEEEEGGVRGPGPGDPNRFFSVAKIFLIARRV